MKGFADLHNHQFAYLGFGGLAFHGSAFGDPRLALVSCENIHGPGGLGDVLGSLAKMAYGGDPFGHRTGGYPEFDGWPRWDSITHQSVYEEWLARAVHGGLRLMVMLAVNNEHLCALATRAAHFGCNDMDAVDRQIAAARTMEAYIDGKSGGAGRGWYRIVHSPGEAQEVITSNRLAVVLGVEVDYLFNCREERDLSLEQLKHALDKYYAQGVRHLFPLHFGNNGFGGTAFQNELQLTGDEWVPSPLNPFPTLALYRVQTEAAGSDGYEYRTGRRNIRGLTELGKELVKEMIARGMVIDVDHMSARSKADTLDICERAAYPVVSGHTGFIDVSIGGKRHEGQLRAEELERIRKVGGMVAAIVRQGNLEEIKTWEAPGRATVPHQCGNSSNTFAQAYLYAVTKMQGGPVGFGTDFNGFAGLPGPRFGSDGCQGGGAPSPQQVIYDFTAAATGKRMPRHVFGNKRFDVNFDGLAHVGMLPDWIADLEAIGLGATDLEPLLNSAQGYVDMWERAQRSAAGR